jgi:glycosyltransferase involved in cell wall biosynthesis
MKNIYHITENVAFESGGVRTILILLHQHLLENKFNSNIITNKKESFDDFLEFKSNYIWNYSKNMYPFIDLINTDSLFHLHGVYTYSQYIAAEIALKKSIPTIVSPHGMLEPRVLEKNPFKKKIYLKLILSKILTNAKVLHCITPIEKENLFKLTRHKNIIEIPNLIDLSIIPKGLNYKPKEDYFIFIGRPDKIKGIEMLINVFNTISNKNIKLKIVGTENEYTLYLKNIVKKYNLEDRVEFLGGIFSVEKYNLISNARALIAPSYSEVIGMVNLEAAACKTPVITTFQTGLKTEFGKNGGVLINPVFTELKQAMLESLDWSEIERIERGNLLYNFVLENYSWEKKGKLWNELYNHNYF